MTPRRWIALGALWMATAIVLGAFGAHALQDRLSASAHLDQWETAVQYHAWHGLAMILYGLFQKSWRIGPLSGWCFLLGSLLFSGSIYGLSLDLAPGILGPITPIGGLLMISGWLALAWRALRG